MTPRAVTFVAWAALAMLCTGCSESSGGSGNGADVSDAARADAEGEATAETGIPDVPADVPEDECCGLPDVPEYETDAAIPDVLPDAVDVQPEVTPKCSVDADCDDGNFCTGDTCVQGFCTHQTKTCGDGTKCTDDLCDPATGQCSNPPTDCDDADPCTIDGCLPTSGCKHDPIPDCCPGTVILEEAFETPLTWSVVDEMGPEDGGATWQASTARFHDGASSLYFGNLEKKSYDVGTRVRSYVETDVLPLSSQVPTHVRFWIWMDVEPALNYDAVTLIVVIGDVEVPLFAKKFETIMQQWAEQEVNLQAFAGQKVKLRFVFDTMDQNDNGYEGIYVDGFRILEMCPLDGCITKVECNDDLPCTLADCVEDACSYSLLTGCCLNSANCLDDDPCTKDSCKDGVCQHTEIAPPYCCSSEADCHDDDPCTMDACDPSGICVHKPSSFPGCCAFDSDCDDGSSCTEDSCKDSTCQYLTTCCVDDAECDDLDECTADSCTGGKCTYAPSGAADCCIVPYFEDDFAADKGWDYGPEWERAPTKAIPQVIYGTGDPANDHTGSGDNYVAGVGVGKNAGIEPHDFYFLTSPVIDTQGSKDLRLTFFRWLNSDGAPFMTNKVEVSKDGNWNVVWQSGGFPPVSIEDAQWGFESFNVQQYSSSSFQVRFGFNVGVGGAKQMGGWNVDDMRVLDAGDMPLSSPCCAYASDCQGFYSPAFCTDGICASE